MIHRHLVIIGIWLSIGWLVAAPVASLSVKEFGAVGDGVADDTSALQAALMNGRWAPVQMVLSRHPMVDDLPQFANTPLLGSTSEVTTQPEIFLPKGTYRITKTLLTGSLMLRGEPGTVIKMDDPERDILYFYWGYRVRVSGLTFEGGRRQLLLYTGNNDIANFCVENCVFRNSSGPAIWSHNYLRPGGYDFATMTMGPYSVVETPEGPTLEPNDETQPYFANSTLATVSDCRFEECVGATDMETDGCQIERCRFVSSKPLTRPVFLGGARYFGLNCHSVGAVGPDACWFASAGGNGIFNGEFQVDESDDFSPIRYLHSPQRGEIPSGIMVQDSRFSGVRGSLLRIENRLNENSPILLDFDNVEIADAVEPVPAVAWETPFSLTRAKESFYDFRPALEVFPGSVMTREPPFLWSITRCRGISTAGIPEVMALNQSGDITPEQNAQFAVERPMRPDTAEDTEWLDARDFGVDDDPDSDDTSALQALFATACATEGPVQILLPPILMRISQPLELPADCRITVQGLGCLLQTNRELPIFRGTEIQSLAVEHLRLAWGNVAFELDTTPTGIVLLDKCFFYQQRRCSVVFRAGEGNAAALTIQRCTFVSPVQGVDSDAATSWLENNWMSTNGRQDRQAFVVNRGRMHCWGMLGVPMPMKDHGHNHLPVVPNWPFANDLRWFDNYGQLDIRHSRFGGEYYGFVPVFNRIPGGRIAIVGGYACFGFPDCRNCIVFCEEPPAGILFRCFGMEWRRGEQKSIKTATPTMAVPVLQRNFLWRD